MVRTDTDAIYRQLVEHMNEAMWMGDKNERTVYANPKFCEMMGYTLDEILGRQSYDFWDDESSRKVKHVNTAHRTKNMSSSYEGNLKTKDGTLIPVLLSGTTLPGGGTIGIMTDLRQLKEKEERERMLTAAVAQANDAIIVVDAKGIIRSWNKGARTLFGHSETAMVGQPLIPLLDDMSTLSQLQIEGSRGAVETTALHKNGSIFNVSARMTPIRAMTKGDSHWLFIARDITAQRKFDAELASKYEKLKSAYNQFGIVRREMDYLFDLVEIAGHAHSSKELGDFIVNAVIMLTHVDACILRLYDDKKAELTPLSFFGIDAGLRSEMSIKLKGSLAAQALEKEVPLRVIDLAQEPGYQSGSLARKNGFSSLLLLPLVFRKTLIGTLSLYVKPEQKLELFENEFIERFAHLAAIALYGVANTKS